jgi:ATP-binding cassette, subfamily B, multidrug efflux pump
MLFATLLNLFIPQVLRRAIDQGLEQDNPAALFAAAGVILAIALVRAVAAFFQRYFGEWLSYRAAYDLRNDFYESLQGLPFAFHDQAHTGDLMSRATGDITETERFVGIGLMELLSTLLLLVGVVTAMLLMDVPLALLA